MSDRLGRVAPGYFADIIAAEGDPTVAIQSLFGGVRWVMLAGRIVAP